VRAIGQVAYSFPMDIVVVPDPGDPTKGVVRWGQREAPCALGRSGVIAESQKREGDGATPSGRFALRRLLWRADREVSPRTRLRRHVISHTDGWCDDPNRPEYNRPVSLPFDGSAEQVWREDHIYDLVVVLGHNDDPPRAGAGSAIFLHIARPGYAPTEGCVAMRGADLRALLSEVGPEDALVVTLPATD
jgi:L,D-peptidoglycan transpeptidase YkuD (ErfK/YbiS/YcfS/YnhG family)